MKSFRINLKNVAAIAACLAVTTMFSGCEKPENESGDDETNAEYYYDYGSNKEIVALRNVKMKWRLSWDVQDLNGTYSKVGYSDGNFAACAGRSLLKTDGDMDGKWSHYIISKLDDPTAFYFYSLNKNEYYIYEWGSAGDKINAAYAHELSIHNIFTYGYSDGEEIHYTFWGDKKNRMTNGVWNAPETQTIGSITMSAWCESLADKQIAGVNCKGYAFKQRTVNTSAGTDVTLTYYTVYYDPATDLTMSYEEDFDKAVGMGGEHHNKKFVVTEIEYGKTKKADVDAVLNEYLSTHNPTNVSSNDNVGESW